MNDQGGAPVNLSPLLRFGNITYIQTQNCKNYSKNNVKRKNITAELKSEVCIVVVEEKRFGYSVFHRPVVAKKVPTILNASEFACQIFVAPKVILK